MPEAIASYLTRLSPREIIKIYEEILIQNGIYYGELTKLGFETCYKRYRQLKGRLYFEWDEVDGKPVQKF